MVRGYWNRPEETAKTFTRGWLHTGDVARLDEDNFIYIVDRAKDMIIRGGENVYSVQVEAALFEHPAVADCAVIGVPHPTLGEEVGAVIVLRPGAKVTADELQTAREGSARRIHGADPHLVPLRATARATRRGRSSNASCATSSSLLRTERPAALRPRPGCRPVRPSRRSSKGASSGTGTAAGKTPMVRHSSTCGRQLVPQALHEVRRQVGIDADLPGDVVGAQGPELVDLPEVLAHGVVAEGEVRHSVEVRHGGRRTGQRPRWPRSWSRDRLPGGPRRTCPAPLRPWSVPASMSGTQASS